MSWTLAENSSDSLASSGLQQVSIPPEKLSQTCSFPTCTALVEVLCSEQDAQYFFSVRQDIMLLAEGVPYRFLSTGANSVYFLLYNIGENAVIHLNVHTLYGEGGARYVSKGITSRPNSTNYDWNLAEGEELTLSRSSALLSNSSMRGYYVATVISREISATS